jgi:hypothetical protein
MIVEWSIWCHMKVIIFDRESVSLGRWKEGFKDEFSLITRRAKPSTNILLNSWLCNFHYTASNLGRVFLLCLRTSHCILTL